MQFVVDLLADEVALLDPSHLAGGGANLGKVTVVIEDFDAVSVFDEADLFVDSGDTVAEDNLNSGNVGGFEDVRRSVCRPRRKA